MAADDFAVRAARPADRPARTAAFAGLHASRQPGAGRSRARVAAHRCAAHAGHAPRSVGFRGGLCDAARLRTRVSVRPRTRGLPDPHHDRHARRADLLVPARGSALPARAPRADGAAAANRRRAERAGHDLGDRSRPVALQPDRAALHARARRNGVVPEGRHRDAQRALQCADRATRARGGAFARADAAGRADGGAASRFSRSACTS